MIGPWRGGLFRAAVKQRPSSDLRRMRLAACLLCMSLLVACGGGRDRLKLMPSPEIYTSTDFDPYPDTNIKQHVQQARLFYVTDREPATPDDPEPRYTSERGHLLRAGTASIRMSPEPASWQEVRAITQSKPRTRTYQLSLEHVSEIGPLPTEGAEYLDNPPSAQEMASAARSFASEINAQLAASEDNDIYIYIHGYKNAFERPVLVSRELQHFLGYQGAFISFGWPATPSNFAYFKDLETAGATVRNLRQLLMFLSEHTSAHKIHLLGYSAGSRLAFDVTYQLALAGHAAAKKGPTAGVRLGQVILVGSDIDPSYFGQALADGLLHVPDQFTVYSSGKDSALGLASFLFARPRIGQVFSSQDMTPKLNQSLRSLETLSLIDVSDAEAASAGNGHGYFRNSPWVSSDHFLSLLYDLPPDKRGLIRSDDNTVWQFPSDYSKRLAEIVTSTR